MARVNLPDFITQSSFAAGEIAPYLYGRVDQELYYIGGFGKIQRFEKE